MLTSILNITETEKLKLKNYLYTLKAEKFKLLLYAKKILY